MDRFWMQWLMLVNICRSEEIGQGSRVSKDTGGFSVLINGVGKRAARMPVRGLRRHRGKEIEAKIYSYITKT